VGLDICIKARWVFSTVAGFHHFTTFTTGGANSSKSC